MPYYPPSPENSADRTSFLAGGDIEALNVQAAIAELAAERARSGENTDITSLGILGNPFNIQGILNFPGNSSFLAYATIQMMTPGNIKYDAVSADILSEFKNSQFIPKHKGLYLLTARVELTNASSTPFRSITLLNVNGTERFRGQDSTVPVNYAGNSLLGLAYLNTNDVVDIYCYTDTAAQTSPGNAVTFFAGVKIA